MIAVLLSLLGSLHGQLVVKGVWIDTLKPGWEEIRDAQLGIKPAPPPATETIAPVVADAPVNALPVAVSQVAVPPQSVVVAEDSTWVQAIPESLMVPQISLRQVEMRDALSGLAMQHGINLVIDPSVSGTLSLNLRSIRLRDLFRWVVRENGLKATRMAGVLKIEKPVAAQVAAPEPQCTVVRDGDLISIEAPGIPLDKVLAALAKDAGLNVIAEEGAGSPTVRLRLQKVKGRTLISFLAEQAGLELRERQGVFLLGRVRAASAAPGENAAGMQVWVEQDTLVSVDATQVPLQDAVTSLARRLSANMVVLGTLQGTVTMKVSKLSFEQVLGYFFAGTSYTWWKREGTWVVGSSETPGVSNSELIRLKHLKAEDALELVPQSMQRNVHLKLVKSHNGILCMGSRESIEAIRDYIDKADYPVPQILIEALVVDVNMNKVRSIGANVFTSKAGIGKSSGQLYPSFDQSYKVDDGNTLLSGIPGLRDVVSLPKDFYLRVKALEQEQFLKVRSRPQVSTLNGSEAMITVGQTQYFLLKSETDMAQGIGTTVRTTQKFEKIEANVTLTVTPYVTGKGEVTCDIVPDFTEPEGSLDANTPPTLNHRLLKSKVRLRDGETIVLGGLVKESNTTSYDQVPLLGSIPVLGWLFKNRTISQTRSQLLIFVTPHIYYGQDAAVDPVKFLRELEP